MQSNRKGLPIKGGLIILLLISISAALAAPALRVTDREFSYLARCFLDNEDTTWMWDHSEPTIQYGEKEFGTLLGAGQHLRYSSLFGCINNYAVVNIASGGADVLEGLQSLSGIPAYQERQGGGYSEEVNYYNPALIDWIADNIPSPSLQIAENLSFQRAYDVMFRRNAHILALSYAELQKNGKFRNLVEQYKNAPGNDRVAMKYTLLADAPYNDTLSSDENDQYGYNFDSGHAATFWLRRGLDDTHANVFKLLKKVFSLYDSELLKRL
ncbi:MAG: hypothetical protein KDK33_08270 [Leptospiraceae bacterium]|nr:hypothetical protein [Leptospiraceae bacterium]